MKRGVNTAELEQDNASNKKPKDGATVYSYLADKLYDFYSLFSFRTQEPFQAAQPEEEAQEKQEDIGIVVEEKRPSLTSVFLTPALTQAIQDANWDSFANILSIVPIHQSDLACSKEQNFIVQLIMNDAWQWLEFLIENKLININATDSSSRTLIHLAAKQGNELILKTLLSYGANVNQTDDFNFTALHLATQKGNKKVVEILLRANANPHCKADGGHNALSMALYKDGSLKEKTLFYADIAAILLRAGLKFSTMGIDGFKLVLDASHYGAVDLLKAYAEQGLSPNVAGPIQTSVLHEIVKRRGEFPNTEINIVEELLKLGANVHHQDITLSTPLHYVNNTLDAMTLLKYKATTSDKNDQQLTPLLASVDRENMAVTQLLFQKTAKPYRGITSQANIMHVAKKHGKHTEFSRELKSKIGFAKTYANELESALRELFKQCYKEALRQNKKIIFLLGEVHGDYVQYQKTKIALKAANDYATHLLLELKASDFVKYDNYMPLQYVKKHLNYALVGADIHREQGNCSSKVDASPQGMLFRDFGLNESVEKTNQHACMIVGAAHLEGLVEKPATHLDPQHYFVVPICLGKKPSTHKSAFRKDPNKVIFLHDNIDEMLSGAKKVIKKWNGVDISLDNKNQKRKVF